MHMPKCKCMVAEGEELAPVNDTNYESVLDNRVPDNKASAVSLSAFQGPSLIPKRLQIRLSL